MAPSEWQSAMRKDTIEADKSGTIDEVSQRLLLWAKRDGGGLARVEYASEFSREQLLQRLSGEGVELIEIDLPASQTAAAAVEFLLGRLAEVSEVATERPGEGNVVSVSGFAEAFQSQMSLADSLRILNFNRESLTAFPLRQIWWMTPVLLETSLHAMPDMHGWFNPQLSLSEVITRSAEDLFAATPIQIERRLSQSNIDDARQRSRRLLAELEAARRSGAEEVALVTTYLLPALEAIAQAGARQELKALTTQHKALLNHFYSMNNAEVLAALSSGEVAGEKALSFARSLDKLVEVFYKQGLYAEAERLCIRALEIKKSKLGDRHPDTASSLNNLALLYYSTNRLPEAAATMSEVVGILEDLLGPNHPNTLTVKSNLEAIQQAIKPSTEPDGIFIVA
ncbi:MAG: tetratricopeptide repeat protein [Phormidesmis sp.]